MDIVELLENLIVAPHQQAIIDAAADEIERLREENKRLWQSINTQVWWQENNLPKDEIK